MSVPLHLPMRERDRHEAHRAATPLELFFDLAMVVAVSAAAGELHHALAAGEVARGLGSYVAVFLGIWWAWVNFTWFSSAFDTDDLLMRLATMVQMAGVLVLSAGVPSAFEHGDYTVVTLGYIVMRVALVFQWIRAERESGDRDGMCRRYWTAILIVQVFWVLRLGLHGPASLITLVIGFALELLVPIYAERRKLGTPWHPHHIGERYGAFVIIVCGEVILSASRSFQTAFEHGVTLSLLMIAVGAILLVFTLWSFYFHRDHSADLIERGPWVWAYLHFFIFSSVAAVGAAIGVMVDLTSGEAGLPVRAGSVILAGSTAVFLVSLALASYVLNRLRNELVIGLAMAVIALVPGLLGLSPAWSTLLEGLVLAACLIVNAVVAARLYGPDAGAR